MLETQLCLIGFSGDDPNFLSWLGWLRDNMGDNCPPIYLIGLFSSMSESERKTIEKQNIIDIFHEKDFYKNPQADKKMDEAYFIEMDEFLENLYKRTEEILAFPLKEPHLTVNTLKNHFNDLLNKEADEQVIKS